MSPLLAAFVAGAVAVSNFPRDAGGRISRTAIPVELQGAPAVVVAAGDRLVAFRSDGSVLSGFPVSLGANAVGAPASADMDGDGKPEVAVATEDGRLWLVTGGGPVPGFPVKLGAALRAGPSFADVDGDGRPEVLVGDPAGRVHALRKDGRPAKGWPAAAGRSPVTTSVSSSRFAGGPSFAYGCEDGRVHVLDGAGKERKGFPLVTAFTVSGAPVFADLDDDGEIDLLAASQDFKVHAVDPRGAPKPGFPVATAYRIYEGPAIGDLDGDGRLDVVFASADGFVHAVSSAGKPLPGFPVQAGARTFGAAVLGDVDRDGRLEVVVAGGDGTVYAFDGKGQPLSGFPEPLATNDTTASPLVLDLSRQGVPGIFLGLANGKLHAVRVARAGSQTTPAPPAWPQAGRDPAQTARYGPNPPSYKDLAVAPSKPRVTDGLAASWKVFWLDARPGEEPAAPRIEWRRNGKAVPAHDGKREVPVGALRKGETWRFVLTGPSGKTFEGPDTLVLDSAPGEAAVAIEPARPSRAQPARARITAPAPDADGDPVAYRIQWLLDGVDTGVTGETFPADRLRKGALLGARVVASDGELDGAPALGVARVVDTPPGALAASLEPAEPGRAEAVRVKIDRPAEDVDGDPLTYRLAWKVGGVARNLPAGTMELPAGQFRKHEVLEVEVRAFDGELEGPPTIARATARNTPPGAPAVRITPAAPRRGDPLRAVLTQGAEDVDADLLSYRYAWTKNGAPLPVSGDGREVPGREVARGDRFQVSVVALDGEAEGPPATAEVAVGNTPPEAPRIAVEPARPKGGETLTLKILEPARDPDGDPVKLAIAWTRDGRATGDGKEALPPTAFRKGERVRVTVTPSDGTDAGPPAAFEVRVENAVPGAPRVALEPARPAVTAPLRAVLVEQAKDADGDALRYRHRWTRDGLPFALPDGSEGSQRPPYWTSTTEVPAKELKKGQRWAVEVQAGDGEAFGPSAAADTTVVNSPPPQPAVALRPERPRRMDGLAAEVRQPPDADGDVLTLRYTWTRDGQKVDVPPDEAQIARGTPRRGQRWAVEVVALDGEAESPPARAEVVIADTPPGPVGVALCENATGGTVPTGTVPEVRVTRPATDADGDAVSYRYEWTVDGRAQASASGQTRLAGPRGKHDVVRVTVTPWDGELAGPPAGAECTFRNTPPTTPTIALEPAEPTALTGVTVSIRRPSTDLDDDPLSYRHAWTRNGVPAAFEGATIPPDTLRHGELWRVVVTPFDGEQEGEPAALSVAVKNTAPPAPSVLLTPATPAVGEPVSCDARAPERDADGEPVTLGYQWFKDGALQAVGEGSASLPRGLVRRGERWRCEAWAQDGQGGVSPRGKAELVVRNSPPAAPQVAVEPERPRRDDTLACRIAVASVDPDGDAVTYAYAWTRNGSAAAAGADPARVAPPALAKGERWRCSATPSDGTLAGPAGWAEKVIANTPPGPPRVRIVPATPKAGQALRCEIVTPGVDVDGDVVRYRWRWQKNGSVQPFAESSQEVPSRLVRPGDRWRCTATPTDGADLGPEGGSEEVTVPGGPTGPAISVSDGGSTERPSR
ncbi:MAG: FG-GAP-like repeat-containing protein [Anaeromyxobacter sp.]